MKRIVLISCSAQKEQGCLEARKLYVSPLFKRSLEYAEKLKKLKNVHAIYILSAKYGLIELEKIIKPYNTTLTYVSPKNRKADLHVLTPDEKKVWGKRVAKKLEQVALKYKPKK